MKKSLLAFALAGLTASAFAADVLKSDTGSFYVNGRVIASNTFSYVQDKVDSAQDAAKYTLSDNAKANFRLSVGGEFKATDSFAIGTRVDYTFGKVLAYSYKTEKTDTDEKFPSAEGKFDSSLAGKVSRAQVNLGHDNLGTVTLGKTSNVVDLATWGSNLNFLGTVGNLYAKLDDGAPAAADLASSGDEVFVYASPNVGGFSLQYSFTGGEEQQQALAGAYELGNTSFGGVLARQGSGDTATYYAELSVGNSNDLVEGLELGAVYSFAKTNDGATALKSHRLAGQVAFSSYQYAKPFVGAEVSFGTAAAKDTSGEYAKTADVLGYSVFGGLSSTVYTAGSFKANLYLEGAYNHTGYTPVATTTAQPPQQNSTVTTTKRDLSVAVGAILTF